MKYKKIDFTTARNNFSSVVNDANINGTTYLVTKRNIPVVRIQRLTTLNKKSLTESKPKKPNIKKRNIKFIHVKGIWDTDPRSSVELARYLRKKAWEGE